MKWVTNDDVTKWKHFFRVTGPLCGEFTGHQWIPPTKGQWRGSLFSLICVWKNGWVNNRDTDDLRRHRAHYDVTVMSRCCCNMGYPPDIHLKFKWGETCLSSINFWVANRFEILYSIFVQFRWWHLGYILEIEGTYFTKRDLTKLPSRLGNGHHDIITL